VGVGLGAGVGGESACVGMLTGATDAMVLWAALAAAAVGSEEPELLEEDDGVTANAANDMAAVSISMSPSVAVRQRLDDGEGVATLDVGGEGWACEAARVCARE